jgi:hypothetical protein
LQPDTITPGGPQGLNRYAYVLNNPINANDPSGHKCVGEPEECLDDDGTPINGSGGGGGGGNDDDDDPAPDPNPNGVPPPTYISSRQNSSYCGGGPNLPYNAFDCAATATQDIALLIDIPFAGAEAVFIAIGCFGGPEGCAAGALLGIELFNGMGGNAVETMLSFYSAGFSIAADATENGITHIGEPTVTAIAGIVSGTLSPDPILDLIIDGYGSGYNHDVFNGVYSFIPFDSDPFIR